MSSPDPLAILDTLDGYRHAFTDIALWQPYVTDVYRRPDPARHLSYFHRGRQMGH